MSTNVERKGKEKPKKKGRRKGNQPTIPSSGREMKDRQELKLSHLYHSRCRERGKCTTQRLAGAAGEGGTVLVKALPDSGCLSLAPMEEKPVLLSQSPPPFFCLGFFIFFFLVLFLFFEVFFFCSKTKKVAGLCSRRQEVGLWGLCLLIFCPKAMQGINHLFSLTGSWWDQDRGHSLVASSLMKDRTLLCPEVNPGLGCFLRTPTCPERNLTGWVLLGHSFSQILFWSWKHPWDEPWELFPPAAPTFSAWDQPQEEPTEGCWYEGIC